MSKQAIKIQVIGATTSGKSIISREIYIQLKKLGFDVGFIDDEDNFKIPSLEQLNEVIRNSKISIETVREEIEKCTNEFCNDFFDDLNNDRIKYFDF